MAKIQTVLGDTSPNEFGLALVYEHVICDFIGADEVSRDRYDQKKVFDLMLLYWAEIRQLGVTGLVDCTPAFMARDCHLLASLSEASDIHIVTNTGLYKEPYLPKFALKNSADQLARIWKDEIESGIEATSIKAGFIKIAVNPGPIAPMQQKIVRAAARCSLLTGATIACHTASGVAARHILGILGEEDLDPDRLIVVHCDAEENLKYHLEVAQQGAWVEYDALREENAERTLKLIRSMVKNSFEDQLLLSQDAGWYHVGEEGGGDIRGYAYLVKDFVPLMLTSGFNQKLVDKILIENPSQAFQIRHST
jgi:predicted metal-dependent phosphotriesterase family hydrolase